MPMRKHCRMLCSSGLRERERESNFYCLGIYSCSKVNDGDYTEK